MFSVDGLHFDQLMEGRISHDCISFGSLHLDYFLLFQRPRNPQHLPQLLRQIIPILLNLHNSLKLVQIAIAFSLSAIAHLQ